MTTTTKPAAEVIPAPAPGSEYPLLASHEAMQKIVRRITENLEGGQFDVRNLPRIKISRDSGVFQIETAEGIETQREIKGIIVAYRQARIYWGPKPYDATRKDPPSCVSADGFTGVGDPGGACAKCPLKEFKTVINPDGSQGAGQACSDIRQMLFMLPGYTIPHRLDVRPTSIQNFEKFTVALMAADADYWGIVTKVRLEAGNTRSGRPTMRAVFALERRLAAEQAQLLAPYHDRVRGLLKPMVVDADASEILETGSSSDIPF